MALYEVLKKSFIDGSLLYPGEKIEYSGEAGSNLRLISGERASTDSGNDDAENAIHELVILREEYELLFNEKPHHNAKAETLREKIADKRKELGV